MSTEIVKSHSLKKQELKRLKALKQARDAVNAEMRTVAGKIDRKTYQKFQLATIYLEKKQGDIVGMAVKDFVDKNEKEWKRGLAQLTGDEIEVNEDEEE